MAALPPSSGGVEGVREQWSDPLGVRPEEVKQPEKPRLYENPKRVELERQVMGLYGKMQQTYKGWNRKHSELGQEASNLQQLYKDKISAERKIMQEQKAELSEVGGKLSMIQRLSYKAGVAGSDTKELIEKEKQLTEQLVFLERQLAVDEKMLAGTKISKEDEQEIHDTFEDQKVKLVRDHGREASLLFLEDLVGGKEKLETLPKLEVPNGKHLAWAKKSKELDDFKKEMGDFKVVRYETIDGEPGVVWFEQSGNRTVFHSYYLDKWACADARFASSDDGRKVEASGGNLYSGIGGVRESKYDKEAGHSFTEESRQRKMAALIAQNPQPKKEMG